MNLRRLLTSHAFQACALSRSTISPRLFQGQNPRSLPLANLEYQKKTNKSIICNHFLYFLHGRRLWATCGKFFRATFFALFQILFRQSTANIPANGVVLSASGRRCQKTAPAPALRRSICQQTHNLSIGFVQQVFLPWCDG